MPRLSKMRHTVLLIERSLLVFLLSWLRAEYLILTYLKIKTKFVLFVRLAYQCSKLICFLSSPWIPRQYIKMVWSSFAITVESLSFTTVHFCRFIEGYYSSRFNFAFVDIFEIKNKHCLSILSDQFHFKNNYIFLIQAMHSSVFAMTWQCTTKDKYNK